MANRNNNEVEVTIGTEAKIIRFNANVIAELEKQTLGKPVLWFFGSDAADQAERQKVVAQRIGIFELRAFLHAGLKGMGSKWTVEAVGTAMSLAQYNDYTSAVQDALLLALGKDQKAIAASGAAPVEDESLRPTSPANSQAGASSSTSNG